MQKFRNVLGFFFLFQNVLQGFVFVWRIVTNSDLSLFVFIHFCIASYLTRITAEAPLLMKCWFEYQ